MNEQNPMDTVVPVIEEAVSVGKREVETGAAVRVSKRVDEVTERVRETLVRHGCEVHRTFMNQVVDQLPQAHQDGEDWVVPVVEERLVTTRQWVLVEEIRLVRKSVPVETVQEVTRLRETAVVERRESADEGWAPVLP